YIISNLCSNNNTIRGIRLQLYKKIIHPENVFSYAFIKNIHGLDQKMTSTRTPKHLFHIRKMMFETPCFFMHCKKILSVCSRFMLFLLDVATALDDISILNNILFPFQSTAAVFTSPSH